MRYPIHSTEILKFVQVISALHAARLGQARNSGAFTGGASGFGATLNEQALRNKAE